MTDTAVVETLLIAINVVGGIVLWFMKKSYEEIKEDQKEQRVEMDRIKDTYFKKEDFREFKDELWTRLDKMEMHWAERINKMKDD